MNKHSQRRQRQRQRERKQENEQKEKQKRIEGLLFFSTLLSVPCSVFSLSVCSLYFRISFIVFFSNYFFSVFLLLYSVCFWLMFYYYSICSLSVILHLFRVLYLILMSCSSGFLYTPFLW